jgi:cytochrome b
MAVMGLICFRLVWGVAGSQTARFSRFIRPPSAAIGVVRQIFAGKADKVAGHSALGGYAVILLLLICLVMSVSGAFSTDDVLFEGPFVSLAPSLSPLAERVHAITEKLVFAVILLHLAAMAVYYFRLKRNLIPAMVTGRHKNISGDSGLISRMHTFLGLIWLAGCLIGSQLPILWQSALY